MSYIVNFLETITQLLFNNIAAPMAELADALDLGSSSERSTGSIPASRTKKLKIPPKIGPFRYNNLEGFYYE